MEDWREERKGGTFTGLVREIGSGREEFMNKLSVCVCVCWHLVLQ